MTKRLPERRKPLKFPLFVGLYPEILGQKFMRPERRKKQIQKEKWKNTEKNNQKDKSNQKETSGRNDSNW